jgi:hypothetical protein
MAVMSGGSILGRVGYELALVVVLGACSPSQSPTPSAEPADSGFRAETPSPAVSVLVTPPSSQRATPSPSIPPATPAGLAHYSGQGSNEYASGSGHAFTFDYPSAWNVISGFHEVYAHGPTVMMAVGIGNYDINCTGSLPGAVDCGDPIWTVPDDGVVLAYTLQDWPQGPAVPFPTPKVGPDDAWVEIDGRAALFSRDASGQMTWSLLGTPEVIAARYGASAGPAAATEIQAVIDSWKWAAPTETPQPTAIVTGSGSASYSWQEVGEGQGGVFPMWAADSNHVLIDIEAANESDQVDLFDRTGNSVASVTGVSQPMWLDSNTAVAYQEASLSVQAGSDQSKYLTIPGVAISDSDGSTAAINLPCCFPTPNGHGAIAITRFVPDGTQGGSWPKTVVWQDGVQSRELDAIPLGWDRQGDKLAVIKPSEPSDRSYTGPFEVFSWPGLTLLFDGTANDDNLDTFDPSGRYVTGIHTYQDNADRWHMEIHVLDLMSGARATIPVDGDPTKSSANPVWNDHGQLVVATPSRKLLTYLPDGTQVDVQQLPESTVVQASSDGSTVVSYHNDGSDNEVDFRVLRDGAWRPLTLPFDPSWRGVQLSPDGSQVFASTNTGVGVAGYLAGIP